MEIKWSKTIKSMPHRIFKKYTNKLSNQIGEYSRINNIKIDYVVPILRSGAVPAVYIANKLNLIKFAPIQTKWITNNEKRETKILLNSLELLDKTKPYNLLLVEGTFSSGETVQVTVDGIKKILPYAKILFACVVARMPESLPKNVDKNFYAKGLSGRKAGQLFVYPWEFKHEKEDHWDRKPENIFY